VLFPFSKWTGNECAPRNYGYGKRIPPALLVGGGNTGKNSMSRFRPYTGYPRMWFSEPARREASKADAGGWCHTPKPKASGLTPQAARQRHGAKLGAGSPGTIKPWFLVGPGAKERARDRSRRAETTGSVHDSPVRRMCLVIGAPIILHVPQLRLIELTAFRSFALTDISSKRFNKLVSVVQPNENRVIA